MNFRDFLKENIVVLDGGMGSLLQARGLKPGEYPERWNVTHPEDIIAIHKEYFDAGSNVVYTNTFGANGLKFEKEELDQIVSCAIRNAKEARNRSVSNQEKFVSLDLGPCGRMLKPYGDFDFEDCVKLFSEIVKIGVREGVDLVTVETMNDSYETKAALLAVKENCDYPVIVTNAYEGDGKLMTGASPEAMVSMIEGMGADAVGLNCSLGPDEIADIVERIKNVSSIPVAVKPNAGIPVIVDGKTVYNVSMEQFSDAVSEMAKNGVNCVGGCCGTTPEYIKMIREKIDGVKPSEVTDKNITCVSSYTHAVNFEKEPLLIGERINPTGKKRFKQALIENDITYILNEGIKQQEKGVHILDVNVGLPDIDETSMMVSAVTELQAVIDLPLQIDTADASAMEAGLRRYNGKALINSVNGKEDSMKAVFPLAKKYGGVIVCLTLDEGGIPETAQGRVEIAKKIIRTAAEYGIQKKNLIFDTLTLTVSADSKAPDVTLEALNIIKNELGCHTSLGVSNVSFGLPNRDAINSVFFGRALENGLSAAIMNPHSVDMMRTYYAFRALKGFDENCSEYIEFMEKYGTQIQTLSNAPSVSTGQNTYGDLSELQYSIVKGLKEKAGAITAELVKDCEPLSLVEKEIIPALDIVGKGFEEKTVYLPQLLISAEAAQAAFEEIKKVVPQGAGKNGKKIVIATVHGDIHDIGKNIVKLLLENYGYDVIDLGKDVPEEKVLEKVLETGAAYVGLSALMTTTVPAMAKTIELLRGKTRDLKIVVGGAVLNRETAEKIGADKYAKDAMDTVRFLEE